MGEGGLVDESLVDCGILGSGGWGRSVGGV